MERVSLSEHILILENFITGKKGKNRSCKTILYYLLHSKSKCMSSYYIDMNINNVKIVSKRTDIIKFNILFGL